MRRFVAIAVSIGLAGFGAGGSAALADRSEAAVVVNGAVAAPATYSLPALRLLPQSTFSVTWRTWRGRRTQVDQGVSVESLVESSQPTLPVAKNALLRVIVTVGGRGDQQVTFALGELDPSFGNHPAYLALQAGGVRLSEPELVVPGDTSGARTIARVSRLTVAVENPVPTTPPVPGAVTIEDHGFSRVLSPGELASLPAHTLMVAFQAGTAPQQHTEAGSTLSDVLRAAHLRPHLNTWVAAVGSDGYIATVTPAEARFGGRPLLVSLAEDGVPFAQPRLVADGDVKGGRYVSGVVDLVVGGLLEPDAPWWK